MAFNKAEKSDFPRKKGGMRRRKKVCVFCGEALVDGAGF